MSILDKSMFELSTGQLITVMIIAYIISDKDVLLIDEGFEVISLSTRTKILDILETKYYQIITTTKNIEIYNNRRINLINI
jgi:ABC-type Mn2+/Zn2+ transport system ATPase subunit